MATTSPMLRPVVAALLVVASFVLHRDALGLGWAFDDPYVLECAAFGNPLSYFLDRETYSQLSTWNYTPMVVASFALDHALFGLEPQGFYAHQLVALGAVSAALFLLLSRWNTLAGLAAALFFLLSGPASASAQTLMTRHYLEGSVCTLVSAWLLFAAQGPGWRTRLAGVVYLMAALNKEVFVPFAVAMPFLIGPDFRRGLRLCVPLFVALAVYLVMRAFALLHYAGTSDAGALVVTEAGALLQGARGLTAMLLGRAGLAGVDWGATIALLAAAVWLSWVHRREPRRILGWLALAGGAMVSIVPVWPDIRPENFAGYRLAIHLAVLAAVGFGLVLARMAETECTHRRWLTAAAIAIALGSLAAAWPARATMSDLRHEASLMSSREMEFILTEGPDKVLAVLRPPRHAQSLVRIRRELMGEEPPAICTAPFDLREGDGGRYFAWDGGKFADITVPFRGLREELMQRREKMPFSVDIRFENGERHDTIDEADSKAAYFLLMGSRSNVYVARPIQTRRSHRRQFLPDHEVFARVMKVTPDQKWDVSREWVLDRKRDAVLSWKREP